MTENGSRLTGHMRRDALAHRVRRQSLSAPLRALGLHPGLRTLAKLLDRHVAPEIAHGLQTRGEAFRMFASALEGSGDRLGRRPSEWKRGGRFAWPLLRRVRRSACQCCTGWRTEREQQISFPHRLWLKRRLRSGARFSSCSVCFGLGLFSLYTSRVACSSSRALTFNQGVAGSNPAGLTRKIKHLQAKRRFCYPPE